MRKRTLYVPLRAFPAAQEEYDAAGERVVIVAPSGRQPAKILLCFEEYVDALEIAGDGQRVLTVELEEADGAD